jgi:K+-sensing histidine kinase KdpD
VSRTLAWGVGGCLLAAGAALALVGLPDLGSTTGGVIGATILLVATAIVVVLARLSERAYAEQDRYRRELFDAEMGVLARLREARQIREDVVASISHEFRTPLTAIRGAAVTLQARGDRLRAEDRSALLTGIVEHSGRLSRLLEDMLLAASATATDTGAVADVSTAVAGFRLDAGRPAVSVDVEPGLAAYIDADSLDQIVRALADHVRTDARRDRPVSVRARREAGEVVIDVSYVSVRSEDEVRRLFEPFGARESARTGRAASLALYVVRRLVEAHGGRTTAGGADARRTRVRVALRALRPPAARASSDRSGGESDGPEAEVPDGAPAGARS